MEHKIQLLDTVALLQAIPALGLQAGQVGTVVEVFGEDDFEVEFVDKKGHRLIRPAVSISPIVPTVLQ